MYTLYDIIHVTYILISISENNKKKLFVSYSKLISCLEYQNQIYVFFQITFLFKLMDLMKY